MTGAARPYPDEIPHGAYGDDGRPRFFTDPAIDRLVGAFIELASESWVMAERIATLEDLMVAQGTPRAAIDNHQPDESGQQRRSTERDRFIARVLGQLRERR